MHASVLAFLAGIARDGGKWAVTIHPIFHKLCLLWFGSIETVNLICGSVTYSNIRGWSACALFTLNLHVYSLSGMSNVNRWRQSTARAAFPAAGATRVPVPQFNHSVYHFICRLRWGTCRTQNSVPAESSVNSGSFQMKFPYSVTALRRNIHY